MSHTHTQCVMCVCVCSICVKCVLCVQGVLSFTNICISSVAAAVMCVCVYSCSVCLKCVCVCVNWATINLFNSITFSLFIKSTFWRVANPFSSVLICPHRRTYYHLIPRHHHVCVYAPCNSIQRCISQNHASKTYYNTSIRNILQIKK